MTGPAPQRPGGSYRGVPPCPAQPAGAQPRSTRPHPTGHRPGLTAASTGTPSTPEEPRPAPAAAWHQAWQLVTVMTELLDQKEATTHPLDTKINNTVYTADLTTSDPTLRASVRGHGLGYVLQIAANRRVPTHTGPKRVDELASSMPAHAWQTYSAGPGSKGPRSYAWAWIALLAEGDNNPGEHHLLIRRNHTTGELAYLRCYSPHPVPLSTLVRVAGQRWRIEESFQAAKGLTGLDQHQVRRWTSWHRWTTLAMLAHAFLAVATAIERHHAPPPTGLIELTVNEFRRLFDPLLLGAKHSIDTLLAWSQWRRRHQARARQCHYRRREHQ